jgi:glycine/D-amino acid oxidase-like deaminating enzyme
VKVETHTPHGYWLAEAGAAEPRPPLTGETAADVCIVGGGYLGLWTAWFLLEEQPGIDLVLVEASVCGDGPSGRNGGFVNPIWDQMPALRERHGDEAALALGQASADAVHGIGEWCRQQRVDAWYEAHPLVGVSTSPSQDDRWQAAATACRELGVPDAYSPATRAEIAHHFRCDAVRSGAIMRPAATIQPARLARGLRQAVLDRGARVFENSPVTSRREQGSRVILETGTGGVLRAGRCVVAVSASLAGWRGFRRRLSITSSHLVITEPVPHVVDAHGWDGTPIFDYRALLHYLRPTPDGRIALGWGGGPMALGGRTNGRLEVDRFSVEEATLALERFFPELAGCRIEHAWGGPIDVSPVHLPIFCSSRSTSFGYGFTGNGVAPTYLGGQILADLALGRDSARTRLPIVNPSGIARFPPEPLRYLGGSLIRRAMIRGDAAEERGRAPGRLNGWIAGIPRRMNMNLPR